MDTLPEIEAAVDALPEPQPKKSFLRLAERFEESQKTNAPLPLIPRTGIPITQQDIDAALDC